MQPTVRQDTFVIFRTVMACRLSTSNLGIEISYMVEFPQVQLGYLQICACICTHTCIYLCSYAGCIVSIKTYIRNTHLDNLPLQCHIQNPLMLLRQDFQINAMELSKDIKSTGAGKFLHLFCKPQLQMNATSSLLTHSYMCLEIKRRQVLHQKVIESDFTTSIFLQYIIHKVSCRII